MTTHTCPLCSRHGDARTALAWSSQHETDGTVTRICPACTRTHLWLIEAGMTVATPRPAIPLRHAA